MDYPYRECGCGAQLHTGGVYLCKDCRNSSDDDLVLRHMSDKDLLRDISKSLKELVNIAKGVNDNVR